MHLREGSLTVLKSTYHDCVARDDVEDALGAEEPVPQPQRLGVRGVRQQREV